MASTLTTLSRAKKRFREKDDQVNMKPVAMFPKSVHFDTSKFNNGKDAHAEVYTPLFPLPFRLASLSHVGNDYVIR